MLLCKTFLEVPGNAKKIRENGNNYQGSKKIILYRQYDFLYRKSERI